MSEASPAFDRYRRAKETSQTIYRTDPYRYVVHFEGAESAHPVEMYREDGEIRGHCECPDYRHSSADCKHLWAVYLASIDGYLSISKPSEAIESDNCPVCHRPVNTDSI